ncbi:ABC transporter substrate-binding protein [Actinomarinicola tropica]|uniref:Solute-binding protein family 5 domain-containing protein n=1 Tax=Actinomarinicola tropica TaxID=2789776 RepID=A0A5Q2RHF9_9ACTN|nr:ABC transporter substrate-binding protein [Actinomarinicola tropica]QGG95203.1 hypothetical protein GH723_08885 [Actinomarinicola tropica]
MTAARFRRARLLVCALALALVAASCGDDDTTDDEGSGGTDGGGGTTEETTAEDDDAGSPTPGGSIVIGLEAESAGWIPSQSSFGTAGPSVAAAIYDQLVAVNAEGEFEAFLAESIEPNDDLTEWTLTLRPDVVFHDGTPLDAEAVVWNFDELHSAEASLTAGAINAAGVESVEATDDMTVVYRLREPNAAFPDLLTGPVGYIVSPTAFQEQGEDDFNRSPVGAGPFMVEEPWQPDGEFVLQRNPDYWGTDDEGNQLPYLDEITFRPIPDEDARVSSLLSDTAQIVHSSRGYAGQQLLDASESGGYETNVAIGNISGTSIFNVLVPPLDDIRVRQGMSLASNADEIATVLGDEISPPSSQFVSVDSPWYSTTAEEAYIGAGGQDLDRARELIEEYMNDPERSDGKAVGERLSVDYQCPPEPSLLQVAQILDSWWEQIGVDLNMNQVEQPTLITNVVGSADNDPPWSGNYGVSCWRTGATGDPYTTLAGYFTEGNPSNVTNFTDPGITEALERLRTSADFEDRYQANEDINVIANENAVIVWNIATPSTTGWRDDIHGVTGWTMPSGGEGTGTLNNRIWVHQIWMEQ